MSAGDRARRATCFSSSPRVRSSVAARAIWKGTIKLGNLSVPVKLYSAVQDRDVHFSLLDKKQHAPVEQRMVKPDSDEAVDYAQIRKGYLSEGSYVMLEREELEKL